MIFSSSQVAGIIISEANGKVIPLRLMETNDLTIDLMPDRVWHIGIDQSTSVIGLRIMDTSRKIIIQLDFKNKRDSRDNSGFYGDVFAFIKRTVKGKKIGHVICERPAPVKYGGYTRDMLQRLIGAIEEWARQIPELTDAIFDKIALSTWRSISLPKGTNIKSKVDIARAIVAKHPLLELYFGTYPFTDYDSFEAGGILEAYLSYAYTSEGLPQICGIKEKRHTSVVGYKYLPISSITGPEDLFNLFGETKIFYNPVYKAFNERYDKHDNIRMATSNHDCLITVLPDKYFEIIKWKYSVDFKPEHVIVMAVLNKTRYTERDVRCFKLMFPMNEEEYDE